MLQGGYFIKGMKTATTNGDGKVSLKDKKVVFNPLDPIFVDELGRVFFDEQNKNAILFIADGIVYAEKVK